MDFITSFKGGTGPDYVKTVSCRIGEYRLVVDFCRDLEGAIKTSMAIEGGKLCALYSGMFDRSHLHIEFHYNLDVHQFAEAMNHMSEVAHLLEVGEPVLA